MAATTEGGRRVRRVGPIGLIGRIRPSWILALGLAAGALVQITRSAVRHAPRPGAPPAVVAAGADPSHPRSSSGAAVDHSAAPQDTAPKPGIQPPWHENWIPELRHVPPRKERKTTA
jgi:hypothetical protein